MCKTVCILKNLVCRRFSAQNAKVSSDVIKCMEHGYAKLMASKSNSLLKKHLKRDIFDKLKYKTTPSFHSTLLDCIQSGLENHDSGVGIYAPDAEAYKTFAAIFDPIIDDYHGGFKSSDKHPPMNFGNIQDLSNVDPHNKYVVSTRIRCGRSVECYPFNPCMSKDDYCNLEERISNVLNCLKGEHSGKYLPLCDMDKKVQKQLIDSHYLFKEGDRFLRAAKASRFWPAGRGIFLNKTKTFMVWCNEEDHMRIISMDKGGDLVKVYKRMVDGVEAIGKYIQFSRNERFGFLTFCPTNLGTTIRASVHIKLPKLSANKQKLQEIAAKFQLQVRGTRGEHTEAEGGIYDISNKRRLGLTEFCAVKTMHDGILELIKAEEKMAVK